MPTKKILIIEDEVALLYALEAKLKVAGFEVLGAQDGEEALRILEKLVPQVIVLDIILPRIDGWEVLRKIKEDERTKEVPVVIISNLSDRASKEKGIALGARDYLAKVDYKLDELVDKIKELS